MCTIDRKGEEPGLLELCRRRRLPLLTYSPEELSRAEGEFTPSPFVRPGHPGTDNVCERAAVLASGGPLLLKKTAGEGVTAALAAAPFAPGMGGSAMNVLYVVGLGPGGSRWMTWEARAAWSRPEVLCGYTVYLDLIRGEFPDKEYFSTP